MVLAHNKAKEVIKPGITTKEIDTIIYDLIIDNDAVPSFKGYDGFPASICASVNDEVVHGIPGNRKLLDGDIISVDIGVCYKGYHSDSAYTYPVGNISDEKVHLLKHTEKSLYEAIDIIKPGVKIGDIGNVIAAYAKKHKLSVIKELAGHGVGKELHEEPMIPNYGNKNTGPTLKEGMVLAIEPMLNLGNRNILINEDGWTIVTRDRKPSAHFEHTILVTKDGYEILSKR